MGLTQAIKQVLQLVRVDRLLGRASAQVRGMDDVRADVCWPFGLYSRPPSGARGVLAQTPAGPYVLVVWADEGRPSLSEGDTALHNEAGTAVILHGPVAMIEAAELATSAQLVVRGAIIPLPGVTGSFPHAGGGVVTVVNGVVVGIT